MLTHPTQIYSLHEPTETIRDKSVTYLADALRDGSDLLVQKEEAAGKVVSDGGSGHSPGQVGPESEARGQGSAD